MPRRSRGLAPRARAAIHELRLLCASRIGRSRSLRWTRPTAVPILAFMKLYFSPLACSLASHIVAAEIDLRLERIEVDPASKMTSSGDDYLAVHPLGLVPALRLDGGELLTENAAVLSYLADLRPSAALAPREPFERAELQKWLSFVGTELHKAVFSALLDVNAPDASREQSLER